MKGIFVAFEGIDGSGKSTQARMLCDFVKGMGRECLLVREPGGTDIGEMIREILLNYPGEMFPQAELFLFLASRSQLTRERIVPALVEGKVVIADRYADSSVAYQGYGRGIDVEFVELANSVATGGLKPDLVFYIDIDVGEAMKRKSFRDRMEKETFLRKVRDGYLEMASRRGFIVLRGDMNAGEIHEIVKREFLKTLGRGRS